MSEAAAGQSDAQADFQSTNEYFKILSLLNKLGSLRMWKIFKASWRKKDNSVK